MTTTTPAPSRIAGTLDAIREAGRPALFPFVTAGYPTMDTCEAMIRAMVDAGADLFVGHGPHVLRGVEIYKGKPIMYSLGDFIFQNETLLRLPSENYEPYDLAADAHVADFNDRRYANDTTGFPADRLIWEAVVAVPRFEGRALRELALHPITLGFGQGRTLRGRPRLAEGELELKILADVERLSKPFGTTLTVRDGVGYVEPARESR